MTNFTFKKSKWKKGRIDFLFHSFLFVAPTYEIQKILGSACAVLLSAEKGGGRAPDFYRLVQGGFPSSGFSGAILKSERKRFPISMVRNELPWKRKCRFSLPWLCTNKPLCQYHLIIIVLLHLHQC